MINCLSMSRSTVSESKPTSIFKRTWTILSLNAYLYNTVKTVGQQAHRRPGSDSIFVLSLAGQELSLAFPLSLTF